MLKTVDVKILDKRLTQMMIVRATESSAAIDLHACLDAPLTIQPGQAVKVGAGIAVNIQNNDYCAMVLPRSGLGSKGLILGNTVGLIDPDYQGEIVLCLWNRTDGLKLVNPMERVAQLLFLPIARPELNFVEEFTSKTERGNRGFGSTGE